MNIINAFTKNAKNFVAKKRAAIGRPMLSGVHYNKKDYKKPLVAMTDSHIMAIGYPNADLPYENKTIGIYSDIETNGSYPDLNYFIKEESDFDTTAKITLSNKLMKKVKSIWDIADADGLLYIELVLESGKLYLVNKSSASQVKMSVGFTDDVNKKATVKIDGGYLYKTLKLYKDAGMLGSKITIGINKETSPVYLFSNNLTVLILPYRRV